MPQFQHDDLPLFHRQIGQAAHGRLFRRGFIRAFLEPAEGFPFPRAAAPERAAVVQRPVAEGPRAIMARVGWRRGQLEQCQESLLNNIFRLAVGQAQGPAIQNQAGRQLVKEPAAPMG